MAANKKILLIAHRGNTISYPENTVDAFLSAFEKGANGVELDVQFQNGEIIVVHDYLFDKQKEYPKLYEVLEKIRSKGRIEIEIKAFTIDILNPLKKILESFPKTDFELTTLEIPLTIFIKETFPEIPLGLILQDFFFQDWMIQNIVEQKIIGWGKMTKANRLHISFKILNQFGKNSLVEALHNAGFIVHTHLFNTRDQSKNLEYITQWGVDQCTFDNIDLLKTPFLL